MMKRSNMAVMAKLIGLVKPLSGYMALAIVLGVLGFFFSTFITILGGYGLVQVLGIHTHYTLSVILTTAVILGLTRGLLRYGEQLCNHYIAFKLLALIRDKVFFALRRLSPAKLEGKEKGNLITLITSDIELLEVFYAHTISPVAIAALFSLGMCLYFARLHPLLGLLAGTGYITVGIIIPMMVSKKSGDTGRHLREKAGALSSYMLDNILGLRETAQYNASKTRLDRLDAQTDDLAGTESSMKRLTASNIAITSSVILLFGLGMALLSAMLYARGQMEVDGVILSTIAMLGSFGPVLAVANLGSTLQNTLAAGNRVLDILEEKPVVDEVEGQNEVAFGGISCEQVSFAYGEEKVLEDVSLQIAPGTITGICGQSGSGKSTLLKLIMRFWDAQSGRVRISGVDVRDMSTQNLRAMQSFVTQDTHLFSDTIANNLRIAKLDASLDEMRVACQKASIHEFIISLEDGYDTHVGTMGARLSGGERQRIGLARAFLHDAPLILLDEPTSNLDSLSEAVILKSLDEARKQKTIVLVSHRASTMRIAQRQYHVKKGRMS